ncbi:hypothetical protein [Henriciella sp.]|uniref:hypothetical protein n=1 Tax=Henriciella sp. TaxID=1968823 RepID=UPI0026113E56|nr:hypothetical protein [Henriciella sp.]
MDFQAIIFAAIAGAVGSGLGAALGLAAAKLFKASNAAPFIVIGVIIGITLSRFVDPSAISASGELRDQLDTELRTDPLFRQLQAEFPDEYGAYLNELARKAPSLNPEEAEQMGFEFTSNLRMKYAGNIRQASDEQISKILTKELQLTRSIRDDFGIDVCARFVAGGPAALPENAYPKLEEIIRDKGTALFSAIAEGRNSSAEPKHAIESDWQKFFSEWYATGATGDDLALMQKSSPDTPEICDIAISINKTLIAMEGDTGERLRAESAYGAAALP